MEVIFVGENEEEMFLDTKYLKYSRFKNGYLEGWIRDKCDLKTIESSFTYYQISDLIFKFLIFIRTIISLSISNDGNNELLMYLGRPWHYIGGNYVHIEVITLFWVTNYLAFNLYVIHSPDKHYKWLELFAFLNGLIPHKRIGIEDKNTAMNLLKLSRIVLMVCSFYVISLPVGCMAAIALATGFNYGLINFMAYGISWTIIWGTASYNSCRAAFYFPGYFFIICYYLKLRLSSIEKRLKNLMNYSNVFPMRSKISMIRRLLRDHNELCKQIDEYNQYWKKYLTTTYVIFISVSCFLAFVVFISPVKWYLRIEYSVTLSAHVLLLLVITYSASTVSDFNERIFRDLYSVCVGNRFPVSIKMKLMNYIEKVGNSKIGFILTNEKLITRRTFQSMFYNFSTYFLLLVEITLKNKFG